MMKHVYPFRAALLVLLTVGGLMLAYADDTTDTTIDTDSQDYLCAQAMLDQGAPVVVNYEEFLNEYFQIDTPTSQQFEDAVSMYRQYEAALNAIYEESLNIDTAAEDKKTLSQVQDELHYCSYARDAYLNYIKTLFQKQMLGSSSYKVTFQVVDGLKAMNKDLDALSEVFGETFPSLFTKMNNDLPCYARSCASK